MFLLSYYYQKVTYKLNKNYIKIMHIVFIMAMNIELTSNGTQIVCWICNKVRVITKTLKIQE